MTAVIPAEDGFARAIEAEKLASTRRLNLFRFQGLTVFVAVQLAFEWLALLVSLRGKSESVRCYVPA